MNKNNPKTLLLLILSLVLASRSSQCATAANCGVNSATALANVFGSTKGSRTKLQIQYPSSVVSMLQVKQMCQQLGIKTVGVRASLAEILKEGTPCIIGLKDPEHFTVLLDGTADELRILEGDEAELQIVSRRVIESRYSGFALLPEFNSKIKSAHIDLKHFDQVVKFSGIGQKVDYVFPFKNSGVMPLSVEVAGTSCGCTAAILKGSGHKTVVSPGQSENVVVSYTVESVSPVQQMTTLKTNDPRRPVIYLSIRGQVPLQVVLSPPRLYVQQTVGSESHKNFKVIGPPGTEISKVWSDLPYLKVSPLPIIQDSTRAVFPFSVGGLSAAPDGNINGEIFILLKDGRQLSMVVQGEIEAFN
jgi:hypothetical protein